MPNRKIWDPGEPTHIHFCLREGAVICLEDGRALSYNETAALSPHVKRDAFLSVATPEDLLSFEKACEEGKSWELRGEIPVMLMALMLRAWRSTEHGKSFVAQRKDAPS